MRRREFLAASAATLALPAVARGEKTSVLKFIPFSDQAVLDPIWTPAANDHGIMVFDTLYGQTGPERSYAATPQMVAGHTVEDDGKIWKLTLRDGLMFHDGTKVLARDCVASVKRWGVQDVLGQTLMQRTDELSASDDRTIVFRLKKPFVLLPVALGKFAAGNLCAIMPERLASTDPYDQVTEMVGSARSASKRMSGCTARCVSTNDLMATSRARMVCPTEPPAQRLCISIASSGTSFPTRLPPLRRCEPGKSTGGHIRAPIFCRNCARTSRSGFRDTPTASAPSCGRTTCILHSITRRSGGP